MIISAPNAIDRARPIAAVVAKNQVRRVIAALDVFGTFAASRIRAIHEELDTVRVVPALVGICSSIEKGR